MESSHRKTALTIIAIVLTASAAGHTFDSLSNLVWNGFLTGTPRTASMFFAVHDVVELLAYIPSTWAAAALAWVIRGEKAGWLSGQSGPQNPKSQSLNIRPTPPSGI